MSGRKRRAFTLVELLVVVVIIGMLVGLLVPAVLAAREAARQTQCTNNQKELATAIQQYVTAKDRYPGYVNSFPGTATRDYPDGNSWVVVLFPYIGRMDLWEQWRDSNGTTPVVQLGQLICPDDDPHSTVAPLSYVANRRIFVDRSNPANPAISPDDITSSQITPMISEKMSNDISIPSNPGNSYGKLREWTDVDIFDTGPYVDVPRTGFVFDTTIPAPPTQPPTFGDFLSSGHPNMVIVTFCDGHTDKIRLDTVCDPNIYRAGP